MSRRDKVLLVGWDAADWKMIHPLVDAGYMPALKGLIERGTSGNLRTLSPILSPMLWSSICTGKRPFKHGVHGFTEPTRDGASVRPVTNRSRTTHALWNMLTLEGLTSNVVGWWPSHPAEPIKGVMVSNAYQRAPRGSDAGWPMVEGTVHPKRLIETLKELRVHPKEITEDHVLPFVPQGQKIDQSKDLRLDELVRIIADCSSIHNSATYLMEEERWDFTAVYYDGIDHLGHGYMKYHPPKQDTVSDADFEIYSQVMTMGYVYHDMMLSRLLELAPDDATVMLISDHGFHPDHLRPTLMPLEPAAPAFEHRDQGIFVMAGPGIKQDHMITGASLLDITPTILTRLGLPVGEDMDGRPLLDVFETQPEVKTIASWDRVAGDPGRLPPEEVQGPGEADAAMEQLIALGYIERPSDDTEKAVADTVREQRYNLALSYIDASMHPSAAKILADLYQKEPLSFRFGIRLALCLQAMERTDPMADVVDHLNANWRLGAERAKARLVEIGKLLKQRQEEFDSQEHSSGAANETVDASRTNSVSLSDDEREVVQKLRGIARGTPETIDYLQAFVAMARNDHTTAIDNLERARGRASETPGFHLQIGNAYLQLGKIEEAIAAFSRTIELDPENPTAHLGLARAALQQERNGEASEHARKAVGLKFHFPAGHYYLAMALARDNMISQAMDSLETAVRQNPNFPEAYALLALMYRRLGDRVRMVENSLRARQIRRERRNAKKEAFVLTLPELQIVDIEAHLPAWPEAPTRRLPPLALEPSSSRSPSPSSHLGPVVIVAGMPRSGTSMAMQMLAAGGLNAMTDDVRAADDNNPRGYLEFDRTKRLAIENDWLDQARGKALKVVTPLLAYLPRDCDYRIVMMQREMDQIIASQQRMLERLDRVDADANQSTIRETLENQISAILEMLEAHGIPVLQIEYSKVQADPREAAVEITSFLELDLNIDAMAGSVEPQLWRERGP